MFRPPIIITLLWAIAVSAQSPVAPLTPIQQSIAAAEAAIRKSPKNFEGYNDLALAFVHRAREASDPKYYRQAEEALGNSLRLEPENFAGQKIRARILMGRHEFVPALELAKALNRRVPDDIPVYGLVADAAIELGDYREAEDAAQWMLKLRPPSPISLMPAARLRELFGDVEGAVEFLNSALRMTSPQEVEERAYISVWIARLTLATGKAEAAGKWLQQALALVPEYHPAQMGLARVFSAQHRHAEAIDIWRRECQAVPHPRTYYEFAEALDQAGRGEEAARAYAEFEAKARSRTGSADNANRELVFYYAGRGAKPAEALRLAAQEISRRHDVYTRDAYAWALHANAEYGDARRQIEAALAIGIRDSALFYRAGAIFSELHQTAEAARYWQQSLDVNPLSVPARVALASVAPTSDVSRYETKQ
ncbi:MAG: tetratricopeptide repeat protein [Bryobacteraceae bacterium]